MQRQQDANILKSFSDKHVRLEQVDFENVERTKYDALVKEVRQLFVAKTFKEMVLLSGDALRRMQVDGLVEPGEIQVVLDSCNGSESNETAIPLKATFSIREPQRIKAALSTSITNRGEAIGEGNIKLSSIFGRGESLDAATSCGYKGTRNVDITLLKPILGWRSTSVGLRGYRHYAEAPWCSYKYLNHGAALSFGHRTFRNLVHEVHLGGEWRNLSLLDRVAAFAVREQAGHSLKTSIRNILQYSTLNDLHVPDNGYMMKIEQELAGLTGDVNFLKSCFEFKGAVPLVGPLFMGVGLNACYVQPRNGKPLAILDRAYLGGVTNLRGFQYNGIGPAVDGANLGGMASWACIGHLYYRIFSSFFLHGFAGIGSVCPAGHGQKFVDVATQLSNWPRYSLGVGLVFRVFGIARLEVNYCWPFTTHPTDSTVPGIQVGIGVDFL